MLYDEEKKLVGIIGAISFSMICLIVLYSLFRNNKNYPQGRVIIVDEEVTIEYRGE